jgi:hypothetical protein
VFSGTYSQMKEERQRQAAREAEAGTAEALRVTRKSRGLKDTTARDQRRRIAQLQEVENSIASLERQLAELASSLENPPPDTHTVTRIGEEYARLQSQMDEQLGEWERLQRAQVRE